jgi:lipopolysaccharide/colanic/teichoic acid biosynthesis glycosyltransferase/O-antigen ligase
MAERVADGAWLVALPLTGLAYLGRPWLAGVPAAAAVGTVLVQRSPAAELRRLAGFLVLLAGLLLTAAVSERVHPSAAGLMILEPLVACCGLAVVLAVSPLEAVRPMVWLGTLASVAVVVWLVAAAPDQLAAKSPIGGLLAGIPRATAAGRSIVHSNLVGACASPLPPAWLAVALGAGGRRRRQALAWGLLVFTLALVVLSGSRGGWVAAASGCAALLLVTRRWRPLIVAVAACAAPLALAAVAGRQPLSLAESALREALRVDSPDLSRLTFWSDALPLLRASPWLGTGIGSFPIAYPDTRIQLVNLHDTLLQAWLELGLGGPVAIGGLTALALGALLRRVSHDTHALVLFGVLVALVVDGAVESTVLATWRPWPAIAPLVPPVPGQQPWEGWHETVVPVVFAACGLGVARSAAERGGRGDGAVRRGERVEGSARMEVRVENADVWPPSKPVFDVVKRCMDILFSVLVLLALSPLWLAMAVLIRLDSPGPALYRGPVVGKDGRVFTWYKFRTMRASCDASAHRAWIARFVANDAPYRGATFKLHPDPRVTRMGALLRRTSLDEAPQFLNVLLGHMSVVGPRPPVVYEYQLYNDWQRRRLAVRPGITGLYQVTGRSRLPFSSMVELDVRYVRERSLALDLTIMLKTVAVMARGDGAM